MRLAIWVGVAGWLMTNTALAAGGSLDVTISVVGSPDDLPSAVTKKIELPASASDMGRERSAKGLERANEARERGREFGREIAEGAKSHGKGKP